MTVASAAASLARSTKMARYQRPRRRARRAPARVRIAGPMGTGPSQPYTHDKAEARQREQPLESVHHALGGAYRKSRETCVPRLHFGETREVGNDFPFAKSGPGAQRRQRLVGKDAQVVLV